VWGPDIGGLPDHELISESDTSGSEEELDNSSGPAVRESCKRRAVDVGMACSQLPSAWLQPGVSVGDGDEAALFGDYVSKVSVRRCGCNLRCMETLVEDPDFVNGAFASWLHMVRAPKEVQDIALHQQFRGEGCRVRHTLLGKPLCKRALKYFMRVGSHRLDRVQHGAPDLRKGPVVKHVERPGCKASADVFSFLWGIKQLYCRVLAESERSWHRRHRCSCTAGHIGCHYASGREPCGCQCCATVPPGYGVLASEIFAAWTSKGVLLAVLGQAGAPWPWECRGPGASCAPKPSCPSPGA
jgi:hypothetical protein